MPTRARLSYLAAIPTLVTVLTLVGCGSGDRAPEPPSAPTSSSPSPSAAGPLKITVSNGNQFGARPRYQTNRGTPPAQLQTQDFIVGTGKKATPQSTVDVRYSGFITRTGEEFDSSWDAGTNPVSFPLSDVLPGFRDGIAGMQEGGRRLIIIPADQAYGAEGSPPNIGPNEALAFIVDLVKVS